MEVGCVQCLILVQGLLLKNTFLAKHTVQQCLLMRTALAKNISLSGFIFILMSM